MKILLQSALTGWTTYTQQGKFAALLLLAIVYLGWRLSAKGLHIAAASDAKGGHKSDNSVNNSENTVLYIYALLVTLGCICPVTAVILMKYQTAFYSYVWIWAAVPQTVLIAWAGAEFLCDLWKKKEQWLQNTLVTLLLLGIVFLSGNPVSETTQAQTTQIPIPVLEEQLRHKQEPSTWEALELLSAYHDMENYDAEKKVEGNRDFCLWAPKEVMAAARAFSAHIRPVYGRSIWDASLGSYSYDINATWQEDMYLWMSHLEDTGETEYLRTDEATQTPEGTAESEGEPQGRLIDFTACLDSARTAGVDYILLPGNLSEETVTELREVADSEMQSVGEYYLIAL